MVPKKIVLWGRDDVLRQSIEQALLAQKGLEVITFSDLIEPELFSHAVDELDPGAIIIHLGDQSSCTKQNSDLLMRLIQKHPGIKVITISLENNIVEIFNKQNVHVGAVEDLFSVINN